MGGELVAVDRAFDRPGFELLDRGENEAADLGAGGYTSYGVANEMRFNDSSISIDISWSESLSSGIGIFAASNNDSSFVAQSPSIDSDSR